MKTAAQLRSLGVSSHMFGRLCHILKIKPEKEKIGRNLCYVVTDDEAARILEASDKHNSPPGWVKLRDAMRDTRKHFKLVRAAAAAVGAEIKNCRVGKGRGAAMYVSHDDYAAIVAALTRKSREGESCNTSEAVYVVSEIAAKAAEEHGLTYRTAIGRITRFIKSGRVYSELQALCGHEHLVVRRSGAEKIKKQFKISRMPSGYAPPVKISEVLETPASIRKLLKNVAKQAQAAGFCHGERGVEACGRLLLAADLPQCHAREVARMAGII